MTKKIKPALLFLILVTILQRTNGQTPMNLTADLSKKFLNYTESVPREEIYIHSDRNNYVSGEDLWFNIYLIDRQSLKPSGLSKIAYFELLNSENRPVVQKKILLEAGFGPGQIVLPDTLSTGTYTIRAYTNWMKNFLPVNCFSKDIHVYNAFSSRKSKSRKISDKQISVNKTVYDSGVTLKADNLKPEVLEISVSANDKYRSENRPDFYLFIQTHGILNRVSSEILLGGTAKIIIPKNQLTPGINQITVFSSNGEPVAERYIFTPDPDKKSFVSLQTADSVDTRTKLTINLSPDNTQTVLQAGSNISISVAPVSDDNSVSDINDYNIFASEYGPVKWDTHRFKKFADIPPAVLDSLLLGVKSNWIDWKAILSDNLPVFKYPIEIENHFITGKLSTGTGSDFEKIVVMSPPGKTPQFQYAKTDANGNFSFKVDISSKINDLIIEPDEILKNQTVTIETPFSNEYYKTVPDSLTPAITENLLNLGVNQQVRKIYRISSASDTIFPSFANIKARRFYGKPDQELIMKEYITLPVMQEVFFELLVGVFLKTKKAGYEITMNDIVNNTPFEATPTIFVDGVMVKDPAVIAAIDPEMVEKIDVVRHKYFVGDYLFYGIVNIITKSGDFSNVALPSYAIRVPYKVFDPEIAFHSPNYTSVIDKASRVPDFRNTLYWNPSVKPDKDGKASMEFWTSDFRSDFEVNIQGISPDGNAFSLRKIIKVKK
jgi:hypothetical protein